MIIIVMVGLGWDRVVGRPIKEPLIGLKQKEMSLLPYSGVSRYTFNPLPDNHSSRDTLLHHTVSKHSNLGSEDASSPALSVPQINCALDAPASWRPIHSLNSIILMIILRISKKKPCFSHYHFTFSPRFFLK